ncbi:putative Ig domain-containing protein, partial [Staphylococcus aureus]|uniref:putative Ig domain-containing protein n=1 Tax=Staphylococcus aureus TaxID=1280 RepID=UPI001E6201DC
PNDSLRFVKVSTNPAWIQISSDGTASGTPGKNDVGTTSFEVRVLDTANASDVTSIRMVVEHVNHAPYWRPIEMTAASEDKTYNFSLKP